MIFINKKSFKRLGKWSLIILIIFAILIFGFAGAQKIIAAYKIKAIKEKLAAKKIPMIWDELLSGLEGVNKSENANKALLTSIKAMPGLDDWSEEDTKHLLIEGYSSPPEIDKPFTNDMLVAMQRRVNETRDSLANVDEQVKQNPILNKDVSFIGDYSSPFSEIRDCISLYVVHVLHYVSKGDGDKSLDITINGLAFSEVLNNGAVLIDGLVKLACEDMMLRNLEQILARTSPSDKNLSKLDNYLCKPYSGLRPSLYGEIVYTFRMGDFLCEEREEIDKYIKNGMATEKEPFYRRVLTSWPFTRGWVRMYQAYQLEMVYGIIEAWDCPWEEYKSKVKELNNGMPILYTDKGVFGNYNEMMLSVELKNKGCYAIARIAIAIERYSQQNKKLPKELKQLVPKYIDVLPNNAFSGKTFKFESDGKKGKIVFEIPDSRSFEFKLISE